MSIIKKIDFYFDKVTLFLLVLMVVAIGTLSFANIIMRWMEFSVNWPEPLVRHLVFACAFIGGCVAISQDNHIRIDLLSKILANSRFARWQVAVDVLISFVSFVACFALANAGVALTKMEMEFGRESFLGIHSGVLVSIIPLGMALLSFKFFLQLILKFERKEKC